MEYVIFIAGCMVGVFACYFVLRTGIQDKVRREATRLNNQTEDILNDIELLGDKGYDRLKEEAIALKKRMGIG